MIRHQPEPAAEGLLPPRAPEHLRVCFECESDPSRAFIAEAFVRAMKVGDIECWADGDPSRVDPIARRVMKEVGVPLREGGRATSAEEGASVELEIRIQDRGSPSPREATCWGFDDPALADDDEGKLQGFRRVRDEIKRRVDLWVLVARRHLRAPRILVGAHSFSS